MSGWARALRTFMTADACLNILGAAADTPLIMESAEGHILL